MFPPRHHSRSVPDDIDARLECPMAEHYHHATATGKVELTMHMPMHVESPNQTISLIEATMPVSNSAPSITDHKIRLN